MPWLRLWVDILDDPDLHDLPKSTCWGWVLMLAVAKKTKDDGTLPSLKKLSHMMHETQETVAKWIDELLAIGLLEKSYVDGDNLTVTYFIHGWDRWQEPKDRTNAARQAKFKAKKSSPLGSPRRDSESEAERTRGYAPA